MALGDNIFYGTELPNSLKAASARTSGAQIFAYHVQNPERYGVVERRYAIYPQASGIVTIGPVVFQGQIGSL